MGSTYGTAAGAHALSGPVRWRRGPARASTGPHRTRPGDLQLAPARGDAPANRRSVRAYQGERYNWHGGASVELTHAEVRNAREHDKVCLIVASDIQLDDPEADTPHATGGRISVHYPWDIDALGQLDATMYRYRNE